MTVHISACGAYVLILDEASNSEVPWNFKIYNPRSMSLASGFNGRSAIATMAKTYSDWRSACKADLVAMRMCPSCFRRNHGNSALVLPLELKCNVLRIK